MPPDIVPAPPPVTTADQALQLIDGLSAIATLVNPAWGAAAAVLDGIATLIEKELMPVVQSYRQKEIDLATQQLEATKTAALRARVGAPPAPA